jgi:hypothetical protein
LKLAFALLFVTVASADEPRLGKAEREMERGHRAMDAHDFAAALAHFEAALKLAPETSGPYLGVGLAAYSLGRCDRVVPMLEEYLRRKPDSPSPAAGPALEACRVRAVQPQSPTQPPPPTTTNAARGMIYVEGLPVGAEVRIDEPEDDPVGRTPVSLSLPPGPHVVFVSHEGYRGGRYEVNVVAGVSLRLPVQLEIPPPPPPAPPPRGRIELYVEPAPVSVILNGARMPGEGPTFGAEVPGGLYRVVIEKQGYDPELRDVLVRAGDKAVVRHSFKPKMSLKKKRVVAAVAVVVPLVAIGVAVGLGVGLTQAPAAPAPKGETNLGTLTAP